MNKEINSFMERVLSLGYKPEDVRDMVMILAENELSSRYHRIRDGIRMAMEEMSIEELKTIVEEMKEGGRK